VQTWTGNNAQVLTLTPTQVVDLERSGEPLGRDLDATCWSLWEIVISSEPSGDGRRRHQEVHEAMTSSARSTISSVTPPR
jgi:hypothetical protein